MYNILTLNKISETGLCRFSADYNCATDVANPGMLKDNGAILIDIKDGSNYDLSLISLDE